MLLKPCFYMPQALQARFGVPVAREAVMLAFEAHEQHLTIQVFQGGKKLLRLLYVAAQVAFAVNDQQRGVYVLYIGDRRHAHIAFGSSQGGVSMSSTVKSQPMSLLPKKEKRLVTLPAATA